MRLDPKKTACLTLDLQKGILAMVTTPDAVLANAAKVVEFARRRDYLLMHIGVGYSPGYPELPADSARLAMIKEKGLFLEGSPSIEFDKSVAKPGDLMIYKHRFGAFAETRLDLILRSQKIETLVLFGVATSGIVLSTVRHAMDLDYNCVVIEDACTDNDAEVHRVLTEKVFARHARVLKAEAFIAEQS